MPSAPQGLFEFPGIEQILGGTLTRSHGISPAICLLKIAPQKTIPKVRGTLTLSYDGQKLEFPDSMIDSSSVTIDRGGFVISMRILTREWKWGFGLVSGLYNERTNNGKLIAKLKKSPRELAEILVKSIKETGYDISALDNGIGPRVDWVASNPMAELARICDQVGCRIITTNKGKLRVVKLGEGKDLPDSSVMSEGVGINPANRPDIIRLIGGPDVYQSYLILEAVGEENDDYGTLKPIDELSYRPKGGWGKESPQGFWGVAPGEAKDTKEKCRQLALKTVYKLYRIKSQLDGTWSIPGVPKVEVTDRKQIVLLTTQIIKQFPKDEDDPIRFKPAEIIGSYYPESWSIKNTDLGTKYDGQFSIDAEPRRQLVEFSKPVYQYKFVPDGTEQNGPGHIEFYPADLRLYTSYNVKDKDTRQLIRSEKDLKLSGSVQGEPLILPINQDDVFRSYRTTYKAVRRFELNKITGKEELTTSYFTANETVNNEDDFGDAADHYLDLTAKTFENALSGERQYAGIRTDIDLDGAIQQISYVVGRQGATTFVSRNSEHDTDIPPYEERLRREVGKFIDRSKK
ncbi:MAG: hypothetical protein JSS49_30115 [Planctomycetes bacterium]|nr:hypothetical protein [Planctomycetota bacterium]